MNLCKFLAVSENSHYVMAAGPLTKQRSTTPYRVVLITYTNGLYSVHKEVFDKIPLEGEKISSYLAEGRYFNEGQLAEAVRYFGEKVRDESVYMNALEKESV
jgi:hypothetical protein